MPRDSKNRIVNGNGAFEIAFAERDATLTQNCVERGQMNIEIRDRDISNIVERFIGARIAR